MLKIPDFTKSDIDYLLENCNFTKQEEQLFFCVMMNILLKTVQS